MGCAPVLLIGFNRPDFMREQIAAVRAARPARLYVAIDGPREGRPDEAAKCAAVRECTKLVDWPCEVRTLARERNLGCKMGVSGAITWFFEQEEMGIILEDDCRPSPDFFRFASEMLVRYRNDERIGAVCGFNFYNLQSDREASYHFSRHFEVWGWASWRRVWRKYDVGMTPYYSRRGEILSESGWTRPAQADLLRQVEDVHSGLLNTWDIQFGLAFLANGWLSVIPRERLIANVGITAGEATHTGGYDQHARLFSQMGTLAADIVPPAEVTPDVAADRSREYFSLGYLARVFTFAGAKVPALRPLLTATCAFLEAHLPAAFHW